MSHTRVPALRTTYWVPQIGSKFARFACGTKRSTLAPWASAGIATCGAASPSAAEPLRKVLRSIVVSLAVWISAP